MHAEDSSIFSVPEELVGVRLDRLLALYFAPKQSRTYFQSLIEQGLVLLNGETVKKRMLPQLDDEIEVQWAATPELSIAPEAIPLTILYEDEDLLAVNKPAGMVVHPAVGNWSGTFVNALVHHCQQLQQIEGVRPGIVHRLDKDTSGVILAAKNSPTQQKLIELFATRQMSKEYVAICHGHPGHGILEAPIGRHPIDRQRMAIQGKQGRAAITEYKTLARKGEFSYVHLKPLTGRTHQLRVHLQHLRSPVLGDRIYGSASIAERQHVERQLLHAKSIAFIHPIKNRLLQIEAPLPEDIKQWVTLISS